MWWTTWLAQDQNVLFEQIAAAQRWASSSAPQTLSQHISDSCCSNTLSRSGTLLGHLWLKSIHIRASGETDLHRYVQWKIEKLAGRGDVRKRNSRKTSKRAPPHSEGSADVDFVKLYSCSALKTFNDSVKWLPSITSEGIYSCWISWMFKHVKLLGFAVSFFNYVATKVPFVGIPCWKTLPPPAWDHPMQNLQKPANCILRSSTTR